MFNIVIKKQTFTNNGITVEFPVGYATIQDYRAVVQQYVDRPTDDYSALARHKATLIKIDQALAE